MVDTVRLSAIAQSELEESSVWYEKQSIGLGELFAAEIHNSAKIIARNPEAYPKKKTNIREYVVKRFQFVIVYEYLRKESAIYILHIFHTSRNPKHKYKRS